MKKDYPGIGGEPFVIVFHKSSFVKGDVINTGRESCVVDGISLWNRFKRFIGCKNIKIKIKKL